MNELSFDELPVSWQEKIRELRRDCQNMRRQRNEAREALQALAMKFANQ